MDFNHDTGAISQGLQVLDVSSTPPLGGTAGVLTVTGTGAVVLPVGTNAQRPTAASFQGGVRFNTDGTALEYSDGTTWIATGTVTSIGITGSTGLGVSGSPITTNGSITLTLGTELQGLSGLSSTGLIARTGSGTFANRTLSTANSANITVSNGNGVSGNPTIDLATLSPGSSGTTFQKFALDSYGRVANVANVIAADITALVDATYVNVTGDSMTGDLTFDGTHTVKSVPSPTAGTDVANKNYVDAAIQGLSWKSSVRAATTANGTLATAYANGQTVDGVTLATGDRILIKNQTTGSENGIYVVAASGAPTRSVDMDANAEAPGAAVYVDQGTTNADTGWAMTTNAPITLGSTSLTWAQFTGSAAYTAGTGLTLTGNSFSLTSPVTTALGGTGTSSIGSANQVLGVNNGASALEYKTMTAGTGMSITHGANAITYNNTGVTSVALSLPAFITVSGSPVTTTGTLTGTLASQSANLVLASPNGSSGAPTFRSIAAADLPIKLYAELPSSPTAPSAGGSNSIAIGSGATAGVAKGIAMGEGSNATGCQGLQTWANGSFVGAGDAQAFRAVLRAITTDGTPSELFADGSGASQRLVIPNNSATAFTALVIARRTDATGGTSAYEFQGLIFRNSGAGTTSLTGVPTKVILGETNSAWDVAVSADTTNGSLKFTVTGEAAKTIRWVASVNAVSVVN
jgi:hypothetical protein